MTGALAVIYRDDWMVAIDKPAGMLVHRSRLSGDRTVALQLLRDQIGQRVYPVHRLDRPTSGVLLFALSPHSARTLNDAFTQRMVEKRYLAVVRGYTELAGCIDYPLQETKKQALQGAITHYRRLGRVELPIPVGRYPAARYSLLDVRPETGRMHQIRKHLAHLRHPIVGDTTHGEGRHNRLFRAHFDCHRLLLHAWTLSFRHPRDDRPMRITAPPGSDLMAVFSALGWGADTLQ